MMLRCKKKLAEQEKLDHLRDKKARETYDEVRPVIAGGPAVSVEKPADQMKREAADRKAEEKANEQRRAKTTGRQAVVVEGDRVVVERPQQAQAPATGPARLNVNAPVTRSGAPIVNKPGVNAPPSTAGQPSGRPVMPTTKPGSK